MRYDRSPHLRRSSPRFAVELRGFTMLVLGAWLVVALAIAAIAFLLVPADARTAAFWLRLGWAEVLALMVAVSNLFFIGASSAGVDARARFGGIAPSVSASVAAYACLSAVAMLLHALLPQGDLGNRLHLIAQIVLLTGFALLLALLLVSRAGAVAGTVFDAAHARSPHDLQALIRDCELSMPPATARVLVPPMRKLRETIRYSISESSATAKSADYRELSAAISAFCVSIGEAHHDDETPDDTVNSMVSTIHGLTARTKGVAANLVRR